jgi:hypothetical protein
VFLEFQGKRLSRNWGWGIVLKHLRLTTVIPGGFGLERGLQAGGKDNAIGELDTDLEAILIES